MLDLIKDILNRSNRDYQLSKDGLTLELKICNGLATLTKHFKHISDTYFYVSALCNTEVTTISK